jgi:hypothetical protein
MTNAGSNQSALDADRPISSIDEDLLERGLLVDQLAGWVLGVPAREGFVVGVTGPWGSGKTSVLQLLANQLSGQVVVAHFDPWLFSGADQLVPRFFDELASLLANDTAKRIKQLGKRLTDYGAALSPAASVVLGPAGQLVAAPQQFAALRQRSVADQRKRLQSALLKSQQRIVVLIDDIDRLEPREVAEIMRLVKLVADLPGVVHVLSYDRIRVERALRQVGVEDGRAYLEKIVQISMPVPPVSKERLRDLTTEWLGKAVGDRQLVGWDPRLWSALFNDGIDGYLRTLRDGRRLCNVTGAALDLCADEVASMDVLALEAIRVFDPEVHERLIDNADLLTGWRETFDFRPAREIDADQRGLAESLLDGSSHPDATRTILRGLFPAAANLFGGSREPGQARWRDAKRVAARPVLLRYLHLALATSEAPSTIVDRALDALRDGAAFAEVLRGTESTKLDDLLTRVRRRIGEAASVDTAQCALIALQQIPRLAERRGPLDVPPARRVEWFVNDLVENVQPLTARVEAARRVVESAPTLSLRASALYRFRRPDEPSDSPGLDLLDNSLFEELRANLCSEIMDAEPAVVAAAYDVFWLLDLIGDAAGQESVLRRLSDKEVLRAALSQPGSRVHGISDGPLMLHIKPLIQLAGPGVVPLLEHLMEQDEQLAAELRLALRNALEREAEAVQTDEVTDTQQGRT